MSIFVQPMSQALPLCVNHHISYSYEIRSNQRFWQEKYMPVGGHRAAVHVVRPASRSRRARSQEGNGAANTRGVCGQQHHLWHRHPRPCPRLLSRPAAAHARSWLCPSGPIYKDVSRVGNSLVVRFDYADGLSTADGKAPSTFEIAEEEGLYHPATAVIAGGTVVLTSPEVKLPRLVRYGWQPFTRANLVNGASLPASTFRGEVGAHG